MESDSESEQLRARFEALKIPTGPNDGLAKPQLSPTVAAVDRAKLDADLRQRLHELGMSGSDTGTEIDEEELERFLASEDEWYDEFNNPSSREELAKEVRQLMSKLHGADGPPTVFPASTRQPRRQDSTKTVIMSVPNRYSGDSDADDEGTTDQKEWNEEDHLSLSGESSKRGSRDASVTRPEHPLEDTGSGVGNESGTEEDDDDKSITGHRDHPGLRTPPSRHHRKTLSTDTVGRYEALFSSLETPRSLPVMTPTDEGGPLPPAFAKLQAISPHTGKIGALKHSTDEEPHRSDLGPAPKLDIEGWRASKDDKPDTWCCICNADAAVRCTGCDNDLYCKNCFTAGHPAQALDASEHKPMDYPGRAPT